MDESEGQTNEGETPEGQPAPQKKPDSNAGLKKGISIGVLVFVGIMSFSVFGFFNFDPGDATPNLSSGGTVACNDWASAPAGYKTTIEAAANKVGIQPALLGAIFKSEHADGWGPSGQNIDGPWESGGSGKGPFQIENWEAFWGNVPSTLKTGLDGNVQHMEDSALASAQNLKIGFGERNIPINATEQKYIMYAGLYHNRGSKAAHAWADDGYDLNKAPVNTKNPEWGWGANNYALRTWASFQELNVGCQSISPSDLAKNIIKIARKEAGLDDSDKKIGDAYKPAIENCAKYNSTVISGNTCYSWCAAFISWVYKQAGVDIGMIVSAEGMKKYFIEKDAYLPSPTADRIVPGDVLILREHGNSTTSDTSHHVGIVTKINGNTVYTIDGNTGGDDVEKQKYQINTILGVGQLSIISNK